MSGIAMSSVVVARMTTTISARVPQRRYNTGLHVVARWATPVVRQSGVATLAELGHHGIGGRLGHYDLASGSVGRPAWRALRRSRRYPTGPVRRQSANGP